MGMDLQERAQFPSKAIHLVWLPIAAFLIAEGLIAWLAARPIDTLHLATEPGVWTEATARIQLLAMLLVYFVFALALVFKFVSDLARLFDRISIMRIVIVFAICLAAGGAIIAGAYGGLLPRMKDIMDAGLFGVALGQLDRINAGGVWGASAFERVVDANNLFTALAVPASVAGAISCMSRFQGLTDQENWAYQSARLKTYTYMAAGLLVVGVLYLKAWAQYPGYVLDTESGALYAGLVNSYSMYIGVEYSIILSAFALPIAVILSRRADDIARKIVIEEEGTSDRNARPHPSKLKAVREREGLVISSEDFLKTIAALLAPFITGTVANLSSVLG